MTLTFNTQKYQELLLHYQPKIIRTEAENQQALAIVEELMHRQNRTLEEDELYELLIFLIEKFEQEFYLPSQPQGYSLTQFLKEQQNKDDQILVEVLGSPEIVADLLTGKEKITGQQAQILGQLFRVDGNLFLEN